MSKKRNIRFGVSKKKKIISGVRKTFNTVENVNDKVNPLNKKVNKSTTTDTGAESFRLANDTVKKGKQAVKTVKNTVKTTKKTYKTIKNAPKNIKRTIDTTVKTTKAAVKTTKIAIKVVRKVGAVAAKVIGKIIAFLISNPIVLLVLVILIVIMLIVSYCVAIITGGQAGSAVTMESFSSASGLNDVPKELEEAMKLLEECKKAKKEEYDKWIDGFYYDTNHKNVSDLIYMERIDKDNNIKQYDYREGKKWAYLVSDNWKNTLKDALDWNCGIDDYEIIATAYVLTQIEENQKNPENTNSYVIADTKITKETINKILEKVVRYGTAKDGNGNDSIYDNCACTGEGRVRSDKDSDWKNWDNIYCSWYEEKEENPEWIRYNNAEKKTFDAASYWYDNVYNKIFAYFDYMNNNNNPDVHQKNVLYDAMWDAINSFQNNNDLCSNGIEDLYSSNRSDYYSSWGYDWYSNLWDKAQYYSNEKNKINQWNIYRVYECQHKHKEYDNYLEFFNSEEIENTLGFNETEKLWKEATSQYFDELIKSGGNT